MREHGVIASIQPQFVSTDAPSLSSKLPQQLMTLAYPWKSLLEAGISFSVHLCHNVQEMHVAVIM